VDTREALLDGLAAGIGALRSRHQIEILLDRAGLHLIESLAPARREEIARADVLSAFPPGMPEAEVVQLLGRLASHGLMLPLGSEHYYLPKSVREMFGAGRGHTKLRPCLEALDGYRLERLANNLGLRTPSGGGHGLLPNLYAALSDRESVTRLYSELAPPTRQVLDILLARNGSASLAEVLAALPKERRATLRREWAWGWSSLKSSPSELVALQQVGLVFLPLGPYSPEFVVPEEVRACLSVPARSADDLCLPNFEPASPDATPSEHSALFSDAVRAMVFLEHERPATLKSGGFPKQALRKLSQRLTIADPAYAGFLMAGLLELGLVDDWAGRYLPNAAADEWLCLSGPARLNGWCDRWLANRHWCESVEDSFQVGQFGYGSAVRLRQVLPHLCLQLPSSGVSLASFRAVVEFIVPRAVSDIEQSNDWDSAFARIIRSLHWMGLVRVSDGPAAAIWSGRMLDYVFATVPEPEPTQDLVVQPNLEIVAPPNLALPALRQLLRFADASTAAGAIVAQLTVASVRRGMECGLTSEAMLDFLSERAAKGVPQTVTHFIRDVAGQYGQIELGPAEVYVKAATPELLAELMSSRALRPLLRPLTDTVALVTEADQSKVLAALKQLGKLPRVVERLSDSAQPRSGARRQHEDYFDPDWDALPLDSPAAEAALPPAVDQPDGDDYEFEALVQAVEDGEPLEIHYRNAKGALSTRVVEPIELDDESLWAYCRLAHAEMAFKLANIVAFRPLARAHA
jgi:hypothetical protein